MHENDLKLLEESFKKYYFDHFDLIHVSHRSAEREFGYQKFNSGMIRHIAIYKLPKIDTTHKKPGC